MQAGCRAGWRIRLVRKRVVWEGEEVALLQADNTTGYFGVRHQPGRLKPFDARVWRGGKDVHLGSFATAEEAAVNVARSSEGQMVAERNVSRRGLLLRQNGAAPPLTSQEVRQQAQAEGLTLREAANKTGFLCVYITNASKSKPFQARVSRGGNAMSLGTFVTAEEAALCVARTPEGRAAAAAPPLTSEEALWQTRLWDERIVRAVALDIIYEAAGAAAAELSAEVAAEVMAGIALGL